jgi:Fe-S cluster assembly protein SufD
MSFEESAPWMAAPPVNEDNPDLPDWYRSHQSESWKTFLATPDPLRNDPKWRFADLRQIRFSELVPAAEATQADALIARAKAERLEHVAAHYIFANNRLIHAEVNAVPEEAICLPINEALVQHGDLVKEYFMKEDSTLGGEKFAALHGAASLSGLFLYAPRGVVFEHPVVVHHFAGGDYQTVFPHSLVIAGEHASASMLETFESIGQDEHSLVVGMVDLVAEDAGHVQYVALQDLSDSGSKHVQLNSSRAGRDGKVKSAFVNLGATWVRNESINRMVGTGSDCQVYSANLANGSQEYDQRTLQSHEAQHTTSDLLFKNALYDESRTIFGGLIQVHEGSHYTDSFQTCRNLLGSEKAEANAMPGLEINADQVKCSHGSTSGQISDEEIFYLQARGIPAESARQMISLGFMNEAILRLDGREIKEHLFDRVAAKFTKLLK